MEADKPKPIPVFVSYSHRDTEQKDKLVQHLKVMEGNGDISIWQDRTMHAGQQLQQVICERLDSAELIILLVSSAFLASDSCKMEMTRALERRNADEIAVVPVILSDCDWGSTQLRDLLALPKDACAVTRWDHPDNAYLDIVQGIRKTVNELRKCKIQPSKYVSREKGANRVAHRVERWLQAAIAAEELIEVLGSVRPTGEASKRMGGQKVFEFYAIIVT